MATITDGTDTITPLSIGWTPLTAETRNVETDVIDSPEAYVSLADAETNRQEFIMLLPDRTAGADAFAFLSRGAIFTVADDTRTYQFYVNGSIKLDRFVGDRHTVTAQARELL